MYKLIIVAVLLTSCGPVDQEVIDLINRDQLELNCFLSQSNVLVENRMIDLYSCESGKICMVTDNFSQIQCTQ